MGKVINLESKRAEPVVMNEDIYRDMLISAIVAIQQGDYKQCEAYLFEMLEEMEINLAAQAG